MQNSAAWGNCAFAHPASAVPAPSPRRPSCPSRSCGRCCGSPPRRRRHLRRRATTRRRGDARRYDRRRPCAESSGSTARSARRERGAARPRDLAWACRSASASRSASAPINTSSPDGVRPGPNPTRSRTASSGDAAGARRASIVSASQDCKRAKRLRAMRAKAVGRSFESATARPNPSTGASAAARRTTASRVCQPIDLGTASAASAADATARNDHV